MFNEARFVLFLTAAVLLAVAPGPGMLYVLARSLAGGKREGVLSAFGTFLGGMVHVLAAALGVSIILAKSAVAFAAALSLMAVTDVLAIAFLMVALGIAIGSVSGRYHYLIDALTAAIVGIGAWALAGMLVAG